jgi:hypothetical protein
MNLTNLINLKKTELQRLCRIGGIKISGNKPELVKRITETYEFALTFKDATYFNYEICYSTDKETFEELELTEKNDYYHDGAEVEITGKIEEDDYYVNLRTRFGFKNENPKLSEVLDYYNEAEQELNSWENTFEIDFLEYQQVSTKN